MFKRTSNYATETSAQPSRLPFLAALIVLTIAVVGLEAKAQDQQFAVAPNPEVQSDAQTETGNWVDFDQSSLGGLDFGAPIQPGQSLKLSLEETDHERVARIESCRENSLARYESETRSAPEGRNSMLTDYHNSVTDHYAQKSSRQQFVACAR